MTPTPHGGPPPLPCSELVSGMEHLFVAMRSIHSFVTLLRLDTECGYRPSFEAADTYWLVGLFAVSVGSIVNPVKRGVNF